MTSTMSEPILTVLDNGLRIITEDSLHLETAGVGVWVDAGARNEEESLNGISHFLEHMAFKGTENRSALDIAEQIEDVGGHLNAYTSREQTVFHARILKDDLALALDILADILQNSTFDEDEMEREKSVVLQEIGQTRDTPDDIVFDRFQETAYPDQPLGRSILGTEERVKGFSADDLRGYLAEHYRGPSMVLAAAGRVDHDALVRQAEKLFSGISAETGPTRPDAKYTGGEYRESRDLEQVHFLAGFDGVSYHDPEFYTSQVYSAVLGGGMSSRLFQEVREKQGLCYAIYSFSSSFVDGGLFGIYAGTGEEETTALLPAISGEMMKLADDVGEDEVKRAKTQLKAGLLMAMESPQARIEQFARQLVIYDRLIPKEEIIAGVDKVDAAALKSYASSIIGQTTPTMTAMGPLSKLEHYDAFQARFIRT